MESDSINQKIRNACELKTVDGLPKAFLVAKAVQLPCTVVREQALGAEVALGEGGDRVFWMSFFEGKTTLLQTVNRQKLEAFSS